jgi:hypothetical protein
MKPLAAQPRSDGRQRKTAPPNSASACLPNIHGNHIFPIKCHDPAYRNIAAKAGDQCGGTGTNPYCRCEGVGGTMECRPSLNSCVQKNQAAECPACGNWPIIFFNWRMNIRFSLCLAVLDESSYNLNANLKHCAGARPWSIYAATRGHLGGLLSEGVVNMASIALFQ